MFSKNNIIGFILLCFSHFCNAQTTLLESFTINDKSIVWETKNDIRYFQYIIELSTDGKKWLKLAEMECNGGGGFYTFPYKSKQYGILYYRISVIDLGGYSTILKTISVVNTPSVTQVVDGVIYSKGLIEVYNLSGQLLASDNETLNLSSIKGGQMVLIKTNTLIKYFIQ